MTLRQQLRALGRVLGAAWDVVAEDFRPVPIQPVQFHDRNRQSPRVLVLPPGMHLHMPTAAEAADLEQAIHAAGHQTGSQHIQQHSGEAVATPVAADDVLRPAVGVQRRLGQEWVVHPLPQAHQEHAERDEHGGHQRIDLQQASTAHQEDGEPDSDQRLVPVVQREPGQGILDRCHAFLLKLLAERRAARADDCFRQFAAAMAKANPGLHVTRIEAPRPYPLAVTSPTEETPR